MSQDLDGSQRVTNFASSDNKEKPQYEAGKYRKLVLFFYFTFTVTVSSIQTSLSPVALQVASAYGVDPLAVTMTAIIFSITYIPFTFVAIYMFRVLSPS